MKRLLQLAVTLLLVLGVHALGVRLWPEFPLFVDLFLIWTALVGLSGNSLAGLVGGTVAGLTHDAVSGGPFGLHGFANTLAGYGTARLAQRLVVQRGTGVVLLVAGISLLQQLVLAGISLLTLPQPVLPEPPWLFGRAAISGVLGGAIFFFRELWRSSSETRRRQRTRRLKMD